MSRPLRILFALVALAAAPACGDAGAAEPDRGRALYEVRCLGCHGQSVHSRARRVASDFESVRAWVARWNDAVGARWSADEVDAVAVYLNQTYYRFPCPPTVCKVVSLR
jgi:mono/diheme cytochrome c family protein